jgi:hypothetical protein
MFQLKNASPFKAAMATFPDLHGVDTMYAVVTATFQLWPLQLSDQQVAPARSDVYHGDPSSSSLRYGGELHLGKPGTDVILVGHARSANQKPVTQLDVGLRVAERKKIVRVFGDRTWLGFHASPPAPFSTMPLVYERAFGGLLAVQGEPRLIEERNPLGVGLGVMRSPALRGTIMPNLEDPAQLLAEGVRPAPAGFGAIAASWLPRRSFAGTYDDAWQRARAPYLPLDFQPRFFNCAAEGFVFDRHLQGGEPLAATSVSEHGPLNIVLPTCKLSTTFVLRGERHAQPNRLQTVLIEPDDNRMCLTFHTELRCDKAVLEVERLEIALEQLSLTGEVRA